MKEKEVEETKEEERRWEGGRGRVEKWIEERDKQ